MAQLGAGRPYWMGTIQRQHLQSEIQHTQSSNRRNSAAGKTASPRKNACQDWIFSSATNAHIAVDKTAFKSFTYFDSHVLTVSNQRAIPVCGIGRVELNIKCKPGSRESRVITLNDVLYVPSWICNIFSDVYFEPTVEYEHRWDEFGVQFFKHSKGRKRCWGYTENFRGQDRLLIASQVAGRSPMLEDKEREVWSVNLYWPQSQRDRWEGLVAEALQRGALRREREMRSLAQTRQEGNARELVPVYPQGGSCLFNTEIGKSGAVDAHKVPKRAKSEDYSKLANVLARQVSAVSLDLESRGGRMSLHEINQNQAIPKKPEVRVSSLRATLNANRGLLRDVFALPARM